MLACVGTYRDFKTMACTRLNQNGHGDHGEVDDDGDADDADGGVDGDDGGNAGDFFSIT